MIEHIVNISGGKDSTATYLLAIERGRPFRAVWADTGHEHPATVDFIKDLSRKTGGPEIEAVRADFTERMAKKRAFIQRKWAEHGVPSDRIERALDIIQPTGNPFLDLCLWKGRFPSAGAQFCTQHLKIEPVEHVLTPALEHGDVVQWLGIRRAESRRRADTPRVRRVRWIEPKRSMIYFAPIAHWGWNAVFWMHERHGIDPNPLYGLGASRVGCWPCINARKSELKLIGQHDPEAIAKLMEWEVLVAEASKRGAATFFASDTTPEGAAAAKRGETGATGEYRFPRADEVFEWAKTDRGGRQYPMFEPACASEYGMCE
ncbi:hypothetical protein DL1_08630 [Thioclava dalianensis]|uniref:Phosphoadenosine phosphosulphate reductase domain-containing protein n=1 Tax=Thioclava dalianensis TaxID=1185766 RepID=A0A074U2D8_9RHOB|nr:phosphoadenosine phosphosulfate reductase family protein [Thioclava dalianensis]KEP68797.1 hypothetical protein DL1_08630 [Thioclava dalianensis]SFN49450.1 3'-phosphoadenosine 5'-phosphosulfate sulfotransferase (PAPS reductase)/FAD synthetase [Thioclava dalianensis]